MNVLDKISNSYLIKKLTSDLRLYILFNAVFYIFARSLYGLAGVLCPIKRDSRLCTIAFILFPFILLLFVIMT